MIFSPFLGFSDNSPHLIFGYTTMVLGPSNININTLLAIILYPLSYNNYIVYILAYKATTYYAGAGLASTNEDFHRITTCTCFGQNITYECTAVGGITTLWSGTAFIDSMNRSSCEINLRHNTSPFTCAKGQCNRIFAIGVEMVNNHFTSQLNVTLSAELVGKTVECSVTTLNDAALIGNDTLTSETIITLLILH